MTIPTKAGLIAVGLAAMGLQGCMQVEGTADLQRYVQETQSRPVGKIDPLPEFEPYESFLYRATSLRGPFQPLVRVELTEEEEAGPRNDLKPDFERPKEPLEAFKLESLSMVGTIHMLDFGSLTALIRDANGEIHRIHAGNFIGRNYGEIIDVSETQIDIVEIVPNGRDGWMKRPRNLVLVEN
ncbi:pilus assembly protein PilP [Motiliproteus sediminis]|uniref:pilus assembly protein PilP n=1 Tax=Motiliproteus sediminis TaxID=1468178 RepID=UPI001AEFE55D|nr:pilus assembly protein PilP [Motiliproteus sediminis]